ncbi:hypothetical protein WME79_21830 [Sorangium sp. So ce726]|uniref:hypothetical protein n=1 Tax=Sorangium sp. So ce726 TaxID=3133319 RepID=UPI003F5FB804
MNTRTPSLLFSVALLLVACEKEPPSRWDEAAAKEPTPAASAAPDVKPGSAFNAFFPPEGAEGMSRVFTAEKPGYAEAKLRRDGGDVASLSISDTAGDPQVVAKFANATDHLAGMPVVTVGKNQSALLVKNRFQVKVSSQTLDPEARKAWLQRFDLSGLANL